MQIRVNAESAAFFRLVCTFSISACIDHYISLTYHQITEQESICCVFDQGREGGTHADRPKAADALIHSEKPDEQRALALQ